ncbi:tRNA dihydrouridine synthase DusB [Candidatus Woesearchaeota archaeon]|nr:tRNA dihydrouridine synthase DusB [Candidatus Woesearchaeota archaeon]
MSKLPHFQSKAFLAPMAGLSDPALRLLCKELGAGLVVTEFVSIHAVHAKARDITKFIEFSELERPLSCQLFGSDVEKIKQAIKIVEPYFDIIDFNMGCPAPHITQQMACSALLQHPELTRNIFRTMVSATSKPITVKIRSGITTPDKWKEIAKIAEEEGLSMITFHPRTVQQGYSGKADWNLIKEMKQFVKIPVCGNGDIQTPEDAKRMLDETGCDYVMIGRGASTNPYLFQQIKDYLNHGRYSDISMKDKLNIFFKYLDYAKNYSINIAQIRTQGINFSKGCNGSKKLRVDLLKKNTIEEIREYMQKFYEQL